MAEEASALPRKNYVTFGGRQIEVVDPLLVLPVVADVITDLRLIDNHVWLSLANFVIDGDSEIVARVNTRLRLPMALVLDVQAGVERGLADIETAKKTAN